MTGIEFEGELYNDDRMFVLYLCKCTIEEDDDSVSTTIHHEDVPVGFIWSVATFKNTPRYMLYKIDHFESEDEAKAYLAHVEPTTPQTSLGGQSPNRPLSNQDYDDWKDENGFKEYDYKAMFLDDSVNPKDRMTRSKQ